MIARKPHNNTLFACWLASTCLLLGLFSGTALAQSGSYYLEGSAGVSTTDYRYFKGFSHFSVDGGRYAILGGIRLNDTFSLEGGYADYGSYSDTLSSPDLPNLDVNMSVRALIINLLVKWPVSPRWNIYGKLGTGQFQIKAEYTVTDSGATFDNRDEDLGLILGLGTQYRFNRRYGAKVELQQTLHDSFMFSEELRINALVAGFKIYF